MKKKKIKKKKHWFGRIPMPKPLKVITPKTIYNRKKIKPVTDIWRANA